MANNNRRFFLGFALFALILGAAYGLLLRYERNVAVSPDELALQNLDRDSLDGQVLSVIENTIVPRKVSDFGVRDDHIAARYPLAENVLMGRYDMDYSNREVLDVICRLRAAGFTGYAHEYILTIRDRDENRREEIRDGVGVFFEAETADSINCARRGELRLEDIADDYTLIYLEEARAAAEAAASD